MGFFKNLFSRKEKELEKPKLPTKEASSTSSNSTKKKRKKKEGLAPTGASSSKTKLEQEIERFFECMNSIDKHLNEEDFMAFFFSEKSLMVPEDHQGYPAREVAKGFCNLYRSFPDLHFSYKSIKETKPNCVFVDGIEATGTHTGEPYTFVPGVFPAIPAAGTRVKNDEESSLFKMRDGKIGTWEIVAFGSLTGPAGFYEQIGGSLPVPEK